MGAFFHDIFNNVNCFFFFKAKVRTLAFHDYVLLSTKST